jgi:hypothetical protein
MEAPSRSNAITKDYYYFIKGEMNRGTTSLIAVEVQHYSCRGRYINSSYHLVNK